MPGESPLFVLLAHTGLGPDHWDLGLEAGAALATWQFPVDPTELQPGDAGLPARRLADHRRAYLDYEGPVSGGRGVVTRVDRGRFGPLIREAGLWRFRLDGAVLIGMYELTAATLSGDAWLLRRLSV